MSTPNFKASKTVTELSSGRVRDDRFDATIRTALTKVKTVFEEIVKDEGTADEYRRGLERSMKFLNDTENVRHTVKVEFDYHDNGTVTVLFWVLPKGVRKARTPKVVAPEGADAS